MAETWSEFVKRTEDKEGWLAALLDREAEAGAPQGAGPGPGNQASSCELSGLYATAALVRHALNVPEVPESAQSRSRAAGLETLENVWENRQGHRNLPRAWPSRLGRWLQVAFNLIRRR